MKQSIKCFFGYHLNKNGTCYCCGRPTCDGKKFYNINTIEYKNLEIRIRVEETVTHGYYKIVCFVTHKIHGMAASYAETCHCESIFYLDRLEDGIKSTIKNIKMKIDTHIALNDDPEKLKQIVEKIYQ